MTESKLRKENSATAADHRSCSPRHRLGSRREVWPGASHVHDGRSDRTARQRADRRMLGIKPSRSLATEEGPPFVKLGAAKQCRVPVPGVRRSRGVREQSFANCAPRSVPHRRTSDCTPVARPDETLKIERPIRCPSARHADRKPPVQLLGGTQQTSPAARSTSSMSNVTKAGRRSASGLVTAPNTRRRDRLGRTVKETLPPRDPDLGFTESRREARRRGPAGESGREPPRC